jgi:hypothetical protein
VDVADGTVTFTFAPVHKTLQAQLETKRAWLEQLAEAATGREMSVVTREGKPSAGPSEAGAGTKAELKARAAAEPSVQAVLDVFGGQIEDVEEIK